MISIPNSPKPMFPLGEILATPGCITELQRSGQLPGEFLARHVTGDWGEVCPEDQAENELSLVEGFRLMSVYQTTKGTKLWVITEAADDDGVRCCTTLLLPEEY